MSSSVAVVLCSEVLVVTSCVEDCSDEDAVSVRSSVDSPEESGEADEEGEEELGNLDEEGEEEIAILDEEAVFRVVSGGTVLPVDELMAELVWLPLVVPVFLRS